jgi:hypothetical protein
MTSILHRILAAGLAVWLAAGAPALAQSEVRDAPDPYVHLGAAVAFPREIDGFRRGRVVEYDAQGTDASVGYKPPEQRGEMTVYIYPARGEPCSAWFNDADRAVMQRKGAARASEAAPMRLLPASVPDQVSGRYAIPAGAYGFDHPEFVTFLWVGCIPGGQWVVKYRGSFEAAEAAKAEGLAEQLFAAIDWSPLTGK